MWDTSHFWSPRWFTPCCTLHCPGDTVKGSFTDLRFPHFCSTTAENGRKVEDYCSCYTFAGCQAAAVLTCQTWRFLANKADNVQKMIEWEGQFILSHLSLSLTGSQSESSAEKETVALRDQTDINSRNGDSTSKTTAVEKDLLQILITICLEGLLQKSDCVSSPIWVGVGPHHAVFMRSNGLSRSSRSE